MVMGVLRAEARDVWVRISSMRKREHVKVQVG